MKRILLAVAATAALIAAAPSPAYAWGKTGHRVTGAIAERYLTPEAKAAIAAILDQGEGLAEASTWADFMRASPEPFWQAEANPFHYVTVPPGKTYAQVGAPDEGDAAKALERFAEVLKDPKASREQKALALRFTIHLIGDLHQPLHAGNGSDRGGNDFVVEYFGKTSNLHAVWDSGMIDREGLSYSEKAAWLAAKITDEKVAVWSDTNPQTWIAESAALRDNIYPESRDLRWSYDFSHISTVDQRLSMAGVRLAAYLNDLF